VPTGQAGDAEKETVVLPFTMVVRLTTVVETLALAR